MQLGIAVECSFIEPNPLTGPMDQCQETPYDRGRGPLALSAFCTNVARLKSRSGDGVIRQM
jgi:hypothetical protein